jgi:Domain of unknown function (DUF4253)
MIINGPEAQAGRAMVKGRLPGEGPVRLGPVTLPAGKLVTGNPGPEHVAWATVDPVPGSGRVWAALSELHPQTGLVPVLLGGLHIDSMFPSDRRGLPGDGLRPWDNGEFGRPEDPRGADGVDVAALLEERWRDSVWAHVDDLEAMEQWAPFTLEWPGLAAPEPAPLTPAERQHALDVVLPGIRATSREAPEARIGLVAAGRPADMLAAIGWDGLANRGDSVLPLTAVLRSWEDRFGARLIDVGYADLRLLVERPPRTLEAAQRIAAEQVVLADECIESFRDVPNIAARLVNAPVWTFWWD